MFNNSIAGISARIYLNKDNWLDIHPLTITHNLKTVNDDMAGDILLKSFIRDYILQQGGGHLASYVKDPLIFTNQSMYAALTKWAEQLGVNDGK